MSLSMVRSRLACGRASVGAPVLRPDKFYQSREWRDFARAVKAQRGYVCEACGADMSGNPRALIADHIVERKDGGVDYDPMNTRLLCTSCHNRKTSATATARRLGR